MEHYHNFALPTEPLRHPPEDYLNNILYPEKLTLVLCFLLPKFTWVMNIVRKQLRVKYYHFRIKYSTCPKLIDNDNKKLLRNQSSVFT